MVRRNDLFQVLVVSAASLGFRTIRRSEITFAQRA